MQNVTCKGIVEKLERKGTPILVCRGLTSEKFYVGSRRRLKGGKGSHR
jgi:hypothetical protein